MHITVCFHKNIFLEVSFWRLSKKLGLWSVILHAFAEFLVCRFQRAWWKAGRCLQVPLCKMKKLKKKDLIGRRRNYAVSQCREQDRVQVCWLPLLHPIRDPSLSLCQKLSWAAPLHIMFSSAVRQETQKFHLNKELSISKQCVRSQQFLFSSPAADFLPLFFSVYKPGW